MRGGSEGGRGGVGVWGKFWTCESGGYKKCDKCEQRGMGGSKFWAFCDDVII